MKGLFLGAELEISPPPESPPMPAPTPTHKPPSRPASASRQLSVARGSSLRPPTRADVTPEHTTNTRLISIVAVAVAILGAIALVLMRNGSQQRVPRVENVAATQPVVSSTPDMPPSPVTRSPQVGTLTRPAPPPPSTSVLTNLAANPSFEQLTDGKPSGWDTQIYQGEAQFSVTANGRRGGNAACISSNTGGDVSWYTKVAVKPNATYLCKGWARCDNLTGARGAQMNLHPTEIRSDAITGTTNWKQLQFTFESGAQTEVQLNFLYGGWGKSTGSAWFDDIEVIELISSK